MIEFLTTVILVIALLGVIILWICLAAVVFEEVKAIYNYYKEARYVSSRNR